MEYTDFTFEKNEYGKLTEYKGNNALVLAIRNILLSRPGNYPFDPSIGLDISKYQFEFLDSVSINKIKADLSEQLNKFLPSLEAIEISIQKIENEGELPYLGISVSSLNASESLTANFLIKQETEGTIDIYNEIY